jgi:hypothetical protein
MRLFPMEAGLLFCLSRQHAQYFFGRVHLLVCTSHSRESPDRLEEEKMTNPKKLARPVFRMLAGTTAGRPKDYKFSR